MHFCLPHFISFCISLSSFYVIFEFFRILLCRVSPVPKVSLVDIRTLQSLVFSLRTSHNKYFIFSAKRAPFLRRITGSALTIFNCPIMSNSSLTLIAFLFPLLSISFFLFVSLCLSLPSYLLFFFPSYLVYIYVLDILPSRDKQAE